MTNQIKITDIIIEDRQRLEVNNNDKIKESLAERGTIQPIVLTPQPDGRYKLLAGGRRIHFLKELGHETLYHASTYDPKRPGYVLGSELNPADFAVLEIMENFHRSSMTWQEEAMATLNIHHLKQHEAALRGVVWTQLDTSRFLKIYSNKITQWRIWIGSKLIEELDENKKPKPDARFYPRTDLNDAIRLWITDEINKKNEELFRREREAAMASPIIEVDSSLSTFTDTPSDDLEEERAKYYSNPCNPPGSFEEYWAERQQRLDDFRNTIHIYGKFHQGDSIAFMNHPEMERRFDHIITDIPYGIDMEMLNQQNVHGEMVDIEEVAELHDVSYNKQLIADFYPAAFRCTKERAFVITWADQMLWQYMHDCATKAGFAVQRWPITWVKTSSCMNQCAGYNTTKNTEIAIVARKKGTVLAWQPQSSVIEASRVDELTSSIDHPFAKPFAVWEFLTKLASFEGQAILEPFMGRGSGVISMMKLNRNVYGSELDKAHFHAGIENIKRYFLSINPNAKFK